MRPLTTRPGSGIASAAAVAAIPRPMKTTNGSTSGAGASWGAGSSSTSAAAAAPLIIPTASPCTARAANSHPRLPARANSSSPTDAVAKPAAITRRRPSRSESCPNSSSEGASTRA